MPILTGHWFRALACQLCPIPTLAWQGQEGVEKVLEQVVGPALGACPIQNIKRRIRRERALLLALNDAMGLNYLRLPKSTPD